MGLWLRSKRGGKMIPWVYHRWASCDDPWKEQALLRFSTGPFFSHVSASSQTEHKVCVLSPAVWPHAPPCTHTLTWLTPCPAHTQTSLTPWLSMCTLRLLLLRGPPRAHPDISYSMASHVHTQTSLTPWPPMCILWHLLLHSPPCARLNIYYSLALHVHTQTSLTP